MADIKQNSKHVRLPSNEVEQSSYKLIPGVETRRNREEDPSLSCLRAPRIGLVDAERGSLSPLAEPAHAGVGPVAGGEHAHLVANLRHFKGDYCVRHIDPTLGSDGELSFEGIAATLKDLSENDTTYEVLALPIEKVYPRSAMKDLIGASVQALSQMSGPQILTVLDRQISQKGSQLKSLRSFGRDQTDPSAFLALVKTQDIRETLRVFGRAAVMLKEQGADLFVSSGNKRAGEGGVDNINLFSLFGISVSATDISGRIAAYSRHNELVDMNIVGEYSPELTTQGVDYNQDGIVEVPLKNFLVAQGLGGLSEMLGKRAEQIGISPHKRSEFKGAQVKFSKNWQELKGKPEDQKIEILEKTLREIDSEIDSVLSRSPEGLYDLKAIKSEIGFTQRAPVSSFAYAIGGKVYHLVEDSQTGELVLTDKALRSFKLTKKQGTSFTLIDAIAKRLVD